jgi:threonine dehydrogenase-like Zn-dependent dehydrogenase
VKAGVWTGPGQIDCLDWPEPGIADDTVLVQVAFCGFCGTDASIIEGRFAAGAPPRVLGHEVSGVVAAAGSAVRDLAPGDRVACNILSPCGGCPWCQAGQPNHCARSFIAAQGLAEYAAYRPDQVYVLPESIPLDHGALLEPVANCVYAVDRARLRAGDTVVVFGGGPIGLMTAQVARLAGAGTVVLVEPDGARRALGLALGVDAALDPAETDPAALAATGGRRGGFDVAIEASGQPDALAGAMMALAAGGRLVVVSIFDPASVVAIAPYLLYEKEIELTGAHATTHTFPRALKLLHRLDLGPLITSVEPLAQISDVYRRHREPGRVKTLVRP